MVKLPIHPCISRSIMGFELPMFDQWPLPSLAQPLPIGPIIVALVRYQCLEP